MKKGIVLTLAVGAFFALTTTSCGEKFTPLTEEQINAKVDSLYTAQSEAKLQELRAACQTGLQAQVDPKVEELKAAAAAETASK
jgi:hypothetical protein